MFLVSTEHSIEIATYFLTNTYRRNPMRHLSLHTIEKSTRIRVGPGTTGHIGEYVVEGATPPLVLVCSDETVAELYADTVLKSLHDAGLRAELHTFPAGEDSKCLEQLGRYYETLGRVRLARDGLLIGLGGGVTTDLTGFAAATWMRGVSYANCPTTVEAAIDAAIGGKTGINHTAGKNVVGAFHQPDLIVIDPNTFTTLPQRDVVAGLAESVKHALIRDAAFFAWHEDHADAILALDPPAITELVTRNVSIKCDVVVADEREQGQRAILNFGHTVGHALEHWFGYELRHGEAVALGMIAAARISSDLGLLDKADVERIVRILEVFRLPVRVPRTIDVDAVIDLTHGDKKVKGTRRHWVLLDAIGKVTIRNDVPDGAVRDAVNSLQ